jgi:hypothetical protein
MADDADVVVGLVHVPDERQGLAVLHAAIDLAGRQLALLNTVPGNLQSSV